MLSRRGSPDDTRSSVTSYWSSVGPRLVSCKPSTLSVMGNSSPEKPEPRYFMTRRLRKTDPSTTVCRSTTTQSTMNCKKL